MRFLTVGAVIAAGIFTTGIARAEDSADCRYVEIAASSRAAASIDSDLKPLEKKLKRPPFSSWNTFKKLSGGPVTLAKHKPEALKLAKGAASVILRDRNDKRIDLTITIDGADRTRVLDTKQSMAVGDWSVWVHNVKDDGHILALTCK